MTSKRQNITLFTSILISLFPFLTSGQDVSFRAITDYNQVGLNRSFQIVYEISNAEGKDFRPPSFSEFKILSGPNSSQSMTIVEGEIKRSTKYSFLLKTLNEGRFHVDPASIKVNGKTIRSNSLDIVVKKEEPTIFDELLEEGGLSEVFIIAHPNKETVYIGEQLTLDYKLFTVLDIQNYNLISESSYPGFYAQNIRYFDNGIFEENIQGIDYTTKVLKRTALFAQQTGKMTIEPITMSIGIGGKRSLFSSRASEYFNIQSKPLEINVIDVPENAPESFTGAIGDFKIQYSTNDSVLAADDALKLSFFLEGFGDLKRIEAPKISFPDTFTQFDPKTVFSNTYERQGLIGGQKTFEITAVPNAPGKYIIPIRFSILFPDSSKYIDILNEKLTLSVNPASGIAKPEIQPLESEGELEPIFTNTKLIKKTPKPFVGSAFFWLCLIILLSFFFLLFFFQHKSLKKHIAPLFSPKKKVRVAKEMLNQAYQNLNSNNNEPYYNSLARALIAFVSQKTRQPAAALSHREIEEILLKQGATNQSAQQLSNLLRKCDFASYGGIVDIDRQEIYDQAFQLIEKLEKELK